MVKTHSICYGCLLESRSGPVCRTVLATWIPGRMIECEGCIFFKGGWFDHQLAKNMVLSARDLETPTLLTERSLLFGGRFWRHFFPWKVRFVVAEDCFKTSLIFIPPWVLGYF